eukprot:TRINITY_DN28446_c3_g1_i1.p1 TRINITY_DN28446_c3_g1~~TRINITY_DN28446_c3_g1_i1.p1  ORF type:complete len:366 (-),score=17.97 TRINITY_DN28446_c3_g1_i1:79-1176(-)
MDCLPPLCCLPCGIWKGRPVSPPVVQNPAPDGFTVVWQVNGLATGSVEWRAENSRKIFVAKSTDSGLVSVSRDVICIHVSGVPSSNIYYRIITRPVRYCNAYTIFSARPACSVWYRLRLPNSDERTVRMCQVNDTHERRRTLAWQAKKIEELDPDLLVWNGDICRDFYTTRQLLQVCLSNGAPSGWASSRPLLYIPGNHDKRGPAAHELPRVLRKFGERAPVAVAVDGAPSSYCFALRCGPVAIVGLDTGEDKPDRHPVFSGLAAYEPYREAQGRWLEKVLTLDEISAAPHLVCFCHIPLVGRPGDNDGLTLEGYANWSGHAAALWLPVLRSHGCRVIFSGHTHAYRIQESESDDGTCSKSWSRR